MHVYICTPVLKGNIPIESLLDLKAVQGRYAYVILCDLCKKIHITSSEL